ncbi:MAG: tetratricopeptide repeat protein [Desulfovibrionaceae bacterium]
MPRSVLAAVLLACVLAFASCATKAPRPPEDSSAEAVARAAGERLEAGRALAASGQWSEALAELDQALALTPENRAALLERAYVHLRRGDAPRAEADYSAALAAPENAPANTSANISEGKDDSWALAGRGLARSLAGKYVQAAEDFSAVLAEHPTHRVALLNRGFCRARLGEHTLAVEDFSRIIGLEGAGAEQDNAGKAVDPLPLYYRARSLAALGRSVQAALDYERLFALDRNAAALARERILGPEPGALAGLLAQAKSDADQGKTLPALDCVARVLLGKDAQACAAMGF